jgi:hypothetical protein
MGGEKSQFGVIGLLGYWVIGGLLGYWVIEFW